jgi:hypothetical protein
MTQCLVCGVGGVCWRLTRLFCCLVVVVVVVVGVALGPGQTNKGQANDVSPYEEDTVPEFTDSSQVSVFYGSTIALQMSDGRFLSVEEDTGKGGWF